MSNERFCIIPARALECDGLRNSDIKALCYFGKFADKNGWWRLSQVKMARSLGVARGTVQGAIERLSDAGLLEKHEVDSNSGRTSAHYYRVVFDRGEPEQGVPDEVQKTRENRGHTPATIVAPPATSGIAPPATPEVAGPATSGVAPMLTTHFNDPVLTSHFNEDARAVNADPPRIPSSKANGSEINQEFETEFWPHYPHKVGKPAARKAWPKARKTATAAEIMAGLRRYVIDKPPDRSWLNPSTFLNQERWADAPATIDTSTGQQAANGRSQSPHSQLVEGFARSAAKQFERA